MNTVTEQIHVATCPHYKNGTLDRCNTKNEFTKEEYEKLVETGTSKAPLREITCKGCRKFFYDPATLKVFD